MRVIVQLLIAAAMTAVMAFAQWPDGPGKEVTLQLCSKCHGPDVIASHRQGRDEWIATIQKMMAAGAEGEESQFMAVLDYVSKNFGPGAPPINVNKAAADELEKSLGLSAKEAAAIVKYRTDKGAFKAIDDLKKVPDLDFKKVEAQKERLLF